MNEAADEMIDDKEYERIFEKYLAICNQAIEKNKDKFPYMEIWKARLAGLGKNNILQCAVYDDRPKVIYNLQLTEELKIIILGKRTAVASDVWPFRISYLKHVIDNEADYISNPAKLDWGWLTSVFG